MLVDKYLDRADELDVDALCDKDGNVTICGIMQHIEQARSLKALTLNLPRLQPSTFQDLNPQPSKASTLNLPRLQPSTFLGFSCVWAEAPPM